MRRSTLMYWLLLIAVDMFVLYHTFGLARGTNTTLFIISFLIFVILTGALIKKTKFTGLRLLLTVVLVVLLLAILIFGYLFWLNFEKYEAGKNLPPAQPIQPIPRD